MNASKERMWRDAIAEVSRTRPGICAKCHGQGTIFPFMQLDNGELLPLDKSHPGYKGPGMIRGILTCPCCSVPTCKCRTERQKQYDAVLATISSGKSKKLAAKIHSLSLGVIEAIVAWDEAGQPDFRSWSPREFEIVRNPQGRRA